MANLADDIEEFLKQLLRETGTAEVQRSMLAAQFNCAPSQINYVMTTRFTPERGYLVESRRGGGGYIRIIRLNLEPGSALHTLVHKHIGYRVSQDEAQDYIRYLEDEGLIGRREALVMHSVMGRDIIGVDLPLRDEIRARLLKAMLLAILRS